MLKLNSIFAVCLVVFTSFLVKKTLQVQHSCNPMIHSGELPLQCQVAVKNDPNLREIKTPSLPKSNQKDREQAKITEDISKSKSNKPIQVKEQTKIALNSSDNSLNSTESDSKTQSNPVTQFVSEHSDDIVGGIAGVAVGAGAVAAVGATAAFSLPVAGAALIGLGVWYAVRTIF